MTSRSVPPAAFPNFVLKLRSYMVRKPSHLSEDVMRSQEGTLRMASLAEIQKVPDVGKGRWTGQGKCRFRKGREVS